MSFIDKFLNMMNLNPEDEDEEYFDDYDDEPEFEEEKASRFPFGQSERKRDKEDIPVKSSPTKILPIRQNKQQKQVNEEMEVCIIRPTSVEDAREITETLLNGRTVLLNMEGINLDVAQRIIDFTSGSCFALNGNLQKVSNYIFVLTPPNVEISGDIQEFIGSFDNSPIQTDL